MGQIPDFSLVIPVYNEQGNLQTLFTEIKAAMDPLARPWEALFIDDGSLDQSLEVIRDICREHKEARYLAFARNRGQSAAFCAGFDAARAKVLITMDSDLQNDPADIPGLLAEFEKGFDLVLGRRARRRDSLVKRMSSRIGNAVRNWVTHDGVRDTGCSLKVMRADLALNLPRFRNMHRFLPALMKMRGARLAEVDVNHRPRHSGRSKYGTWDRALAGLFDLIGVSWLIRRDLDYQIKERKD
ncbi:MAG: glycosyltransferase family 2 protein [Desulfovibrionaceae bacterium]|nr:glycosyltransferase family 2 protein [Desulfovibrionaceae bacterium]